jgi:putative endonuclease
MPERTYYVYILSSRSRKLYTGMTNDLTARLWQHKTQSVDGFTSRYNINRLVYFEEYTSPQDAIEREKVIKSWNRAKRVSLIEQANPGWDDLSEEWFAPSVVAAELRQNGEASAPQ